MRKIAIYLCVLGLMGCQTLKVDHKSSNEKVFVVNKDGTREELTNNGYHGEGAQHKNIAYDPTNLWDRLGAQFRLPIPKNNAKIEYYKKWYLSHPQHLTVLAQKARPYLYMVTQNLKKHHMPMELTLLPAIESTYKTTVYSKHGAAGMWQFIPMTAKRFGLMINDTYDARRDPLASTEAAIKLFSYLSKEFNNNWNYAIAAYNSGEGSVARAIKKNERLHKKTDYWSLDLSEETSNYIPKLLALADIVKNYKAYGIDLPKIPYHPAVKKIDLPVRLDLDIGAKLAQISKDDLIALNAGYKHKTIKRQKKALLLPIDKVGIFKKNLAKAKVTYKKVRIAKLYKVKKGDNISAIARRYKVSLKSLLKMNKLKSDKILIGQVLKLPLSSQENG